MILVDAPVWIDHLRRGNGRLQTLLHEETVFCHPFVIGELACGNLQNRNEILYLLGSLPQVHVAEHSEVLHALHAHKLHGRGLGWIDAHLLASALLSGCDLWTLDKSLLSAAKRLGISFD